MTERLHFHFSLLCIEGGNGSPLQCSCLENPRDGVAQSWTRLKWLSSSSSSVRKGEGNGNPLQYSCLENPMGRRAWWAAVHGVAKSWTRLSYFIFTFLFHALEKAMATHSSVLAWRIPGTGEPGGLLSMGSHRVGHDWSDLAAAVLGRNAEEKAIAQNICNVTGLKRKRNIQTKCFSSCLWKQQLMRQDSGEKICVCMGWDTKN